MDTVRIGAWVMAGALAASAQAALVSPAHVSFGDDPRTQVTVTWRTTAADSSVVRYGTTTAYSLRATGESVLSGSGDGYQNSVRLSGLTPGTLYHYSAHGTDQTFRTAPAGPEDFSFMVPGDIQNTESPSPGWSQCIDWYTGRFGAPPFLVTVGDNTDLGQSQPHWNMFWNDGAALYGSSVIMPTLGNHECRLNHQYTEPTYPVWPSYYLEQFPGLPDNGDSTFQGVWYAFEYGDALFVSLNSQYNEYGDLFRGTMYTTVIRKARQTAFLERVFAQSTAKWKFLYTHFPVGINEWKSLAMLNNVTVFFNGHTHSYGESTAGGVLYYDAGAQRSDPPYICRVTVSSDSVVVTTWNYSTSTVVQRDVLTAPATGTRAMRSTAVARAAGAARCFDLSGRGLPAGGRQVHGIYLREDASAVTAQASLRAR